MPGLAIVGRTLLALGLAFLLRRSQFTRGPGGDERVWNPGSMLRRHAVGLDAVDRSSGSSPWLLRIRYGSCQGCESSPKTP
jgi:hypothetical protein